MLHPCAHLPVLLCSSMEAEIQSQLGCWLWGCTRYLLFCSVPVAPVPHRLPAPWVKLLPVRAGVAEQQLVFPAGWAVGSQTFSSCQKNLWPPRVDKGPAWHVAKPCPSQLTWL